jgi:hypothetical protein
MTLILSVLDVQSHVEGPEGTLPNSAAHLVLFAISKRRPSTGYVETLLGSPFTTQSNFVMCLLEQFGEALLCNGQSKIDLEHYQD